MNRLPFALKTLKSVVAGVLLLLVAGGLAQASESPVQVVQSLNNTLLATMKDARRLGFDGRYKLLAPVLRGSFNYPLMAEVVAGGYWERLTADERTELVKAFTEMSIATFAARFDGYSGEQFVADGEKPALRGAVLVKNKLVEHSGKAVPIDYLLRRFPDGWRIIDVFLDANYSELAIKRSEYSSILERQGFNGLMKAIKAKIAQLQAGT